MASYKPNIDDIRLIICFQGYDLNYHFILREIGYWYNKNYGTIPFNCKINKNNLDIRNRNKILEAELIHGIKQKNVTDFGLTMCEIKSVLKTLYHMAGSDNPNAKFIGICREEKTIGFLYKAGLGTYATYLDLIELSTKKQISFPTKEEIEIKIKNDDNQNKLCQLHDKSICNSLICSGLKAKCIGEFLLNINNNKN